MEKQEKTLSQIKLKYYSAPKANDPTAPRFKCFYCQESKNRMGGGFVDKKGKTQQYCEDCAVWFYKKDNNFKTLKAARARRRRMFDVGYLFNEMVIDAYSAWRGLKSADECPCRDELFFIAGDLYNKLYAKEEKMELEEYAEQSDIEKSLRERLRVVDSGALFTAFEKQYGVR